MQLPFTADVLIPLYAGAGAVVLGLVLLAVLVVRARRRRRAPAGPQVEPLNTTTPAPPLTPPPAAARGIDAPISSPLLLERVLRPPESKAPPPTPPPAVPEPRESAAAPERAPEKPADPSVPPGSNMSVAAAVAKALAVRTAATAAAAATGVPQQPSTSERAAGLRGDARDRLLAVLLDDPARAVGATIDLDACRAQLDRLSAAVNHERAVLRAVLRRLAGTGLRPDQLAKLAALPLDDVVELLGQDTQRSA
ncbi:hypothetical protein [Pseudonocardia sp. TRM90224]|uniref:hypothetical protein n=1 Tax=Pseudonocardia sp. TRM90224 TaxID=2812678 RepID=UPI001E49169B|nr:hypothetical protein [Pseudonocardia sp. TRM90224]